MDKTKRIIFIDIAKGIGIICVLWFHVGYSPGHILNLFFMPLFFLISGMFCNFKTDYVTFFKKRHRQLICPLLVGVILGCLVEIFLNNLATARECLDDNFYNFRLVGNVPLWFLVALFWDLTIIYSVNLLIDQERKRLLVFTALSAVGYALSLLHIRNSFFIGQALLVLPFLLLGYYLKDFWIEKKWHRWYTLIGSITLCSIMCFTDVHTNIHQMVFSGYYVLPVLTALSFIILIFEISVYIEKTKIGKLLAWIGGSTIFILVLHELFIPSTEKIIDSIIKSYDLPWSIISCLTLLSAFLLCVVTIFIGKYIRRLFPSMFP